MTPHALAPLLFAPLIAFGIYRRVRGTFGLQPVRPTRMKWRIGLFSVFSLLTMLAGFQDIRLLEGVVGGLLGGAALSVLALRLTRFETRPEGDFYVPNPWIGGLLTLMLLGRLAWRFSVLVPGMTGGEVAPTVPAAGNSPLTMLVVGLTFGYYIAYPVGLLIHHRRYRQAMGTTEAA